MKEQGCIQGEVNGVLKNILIDTGAEISLISDIIFNHVKEKSILTHSDIDLYTANGISISTLGKADIELNTGNRTFKHTVAVVTNFSYKLLLGKTFCSKTRRFSTFPAFA